MIFYLGTHLPHWLTKTNLPLFISHRRLEKRKTLPESKGTWALDSGGFSELSLFGEWRTSPQTYVAAIHRYQNHIGNLSWVAAQDWMCEPMILQKTGLSVSIHQTNTINNFLTLKSLAPDLPIVPVLQGWENQDYLHHIEMYQRQGIDLCQQPLVGIGSVCRRQRFKKTGAFIRELYGLGLKLHGFGVKTSGLQGVSECFTSTDSMSWSFAARYEPPLAGHTHKNCANCLLFAERYYHKIISNLQTHQPHLFY